MWIVLNDAFLSIVETKNPECLSVRARVDGDIENVFGDKYKVHKIKFRDYAFRAFIPRRVVAKVLSDRVIGINYGNFKDSINPKEKDRKDMAYAIWNASANFQIGRGYGEPMFSHTNWSWEYYYDRQDKRAARKAARNGGAADDFDDGIRYGVA